MANNWRDLYLFFIRPALAACLPWSWGARLIRRWSARPAVDEALLAAAAAAQVLPVQDERQWLARFRLVRDFDRADMYLVATRGAKWMDRWLEVEGSWPERGPFLIVTFHYGGGFWGIRHLRRAGRTAPTVQVVRLPLDLALYGGAWASFLYSAVRTWITGRQAGVPMLPGDPYSVRKLGATLRQGQCALGLLDVPAEAGRKAIEVEFFGRPARFPRGLLYLARTEAVPIVVYTLRPKGDDGRRLLRIHPPIHVQDEQAAGAQVVAILEAAIREDPPAWHHWSGVNAFFANPETPASK